jgi:hypothetical protein
MPWRYATPDDALVGYSWMIEPLAQMGLVVREWPAMPSVKLRIVARVGRNYLISFSWGRY